MPGELDLLRTVHLFLNRWSDDCRLRNTLEQDLKEAKQQIIDLRSSASAVKAERDSMRAETLNQRSRYEQLTETLARVTKTAEERAEAATEVIAAHSDAIARFNAKYSAHGRAAKTA